MKARTFLFAVIPRVWSTTALGLVQFTDGQTHVISAPLNDDVWVDFQAPGMQTTVNVLDGASIPSPHQLQLFQTGQANISGGLVDGVITNNNSVATMSGGEISSFWAYNSSQVTISDGLIYFLESHNSSRLTMSGGVLNNIWQAFDNSQVTITGGTVKQVVEVDDSSQVTLSGGTVGEDLNGLALTDSSSAELTFLGGSLHGYLTAGLNSRINWSGGTVDATVTSLTLDDSAALTVAGSDFRIDGNPVSYGTISSLLGNSYNLEPSRTLTGTLANGDPINNTFMIGHTAHMILIPEPATLVLFGSASLLLARRPRHTPQFQ